MTTATDTKVRRFDRRKAAIAAAVLVGVVTVVGILIWKANPAVAQIPAKLEVVARQVLYREDSKAKWEPATDGMSLPQGSGLKTDKSGRASVVFFEGSVSRLDTNTVVAVNETGKLENGEGSSAIGMFQTLGRTWHRVKKLVGVNSRYQVKTPTAAAAVRGTTFRVDVLRDGTTTYFVFEGTLDITTSSGRKIVLEAGTKVTIPPDTDVTQDDVEAITEADKDAWYVFNMAQDAALTDAENGVPGDTNPPAEPADPGSPTQTDTQQGPSAPVSPVSTQSSGRKPPTSRGNRPPTLAPIADVAAYEGTLVAFVATATDPDGDTIVYSASPLPDGAIFNTRTGSFSWTPGYAQAGTYSIAVSANDGRLSDRQTVEIVIRDVNRPPVFYPTNAYSVTEGELLVFAVSATEPDGEPLYYSASDLPAGATFDGRTRVFSWRPDLGQAGVYRVTFAVSDGVNTVTRPVAITVLEFSPPTSAGAVTCYAQLVNVRTTVMTPSAVEPGTMFLVSAAISPADDALAEGGSATIRVPEGLRVMGSPDSLAVSPTPTAASTSVSWVVQAERPGAYVVTVQAGLPIPGATDIGSGSGVVRVEESRPSTLWERIFSLLSGPSR